MKGVSGRGQNTAKTSRELNNFREIGSSSLCLEHRFEGMGVIDKARKIVKGRSRRAL